MRFLLFAALCGVFAAPAIAAPAAAPPPMSAEALAAHIKVLASDAFEGRAPGTPGDAKTVAYLEEQFRAAGLEPANGTSYLQPTPLVEYAHARAPRLSVRGPDGAKSYSYRDQFVVWTRRPERRQRLRDAELVFVGYGVTSPERGWNDYAHADIKGKIAVVLINDPDFETGGQSGPFDGKAMTYFGRWTYKIEEATRQGAAGVLIIHETAPAAYGWPVVLTSWTLPQLDIAVDGGARMAVEGWVTTGVAADLFARAGLDFAALKAAAQKPGLVAKPMGLKASFDIETKTRRYESANVAGVIRGSERPDETILYTTHWDHLGRCQAVNGDDICNGALDNASGTGGLIELARAFAAGPRPRRSVLFLAVTAEEKGLLGSEYYAQKPLFPLEKTVANINMDGLPGYGLTRNVEVVGYGKTELEDMLKRYAAAQMRYVSPDPFPERGFYYRSDQFSLAKVGVPALYAGAGIDLVDGGEARGRELDSAYLADRYHKPDDEYSPDWDLAGATQDLALLYAIGRDLAEGDAWPEWKAGAEFKPIRDATSDARKR